MTRDKPAAQAVISFALLSEVDHGRAGPFSTVLAAIRQALGVPPPTPLDTIRPDGTLPDAPDAAEVACEPPPGFVRVSVLLTEQQALCARQWDEANCRVCATKACEPAGTPSRGQHSPNG